MSQVEDLSHERNCAALSAHMLASALRHTGLRKPAAAGVQDCVHDHTLTCVKSLQFSFTLSQRTMRAAPWLASASGSLSSQASSNVGLMCILTSSHGQTALLC